MKSERDVAQDEIVNTRFKQISFSTWTQAEKFIESLGEQHIYRGHGEESWELESSLRRACRTRPVDQMEKLLDSAFRAAAHLFDLNLPSPDDLITWLALMQHHGVPTRLLDWTRSGHVAAYFAAVHEPRISASFAIYALDYVLLHRAAVTHIGRSETMDQILPLGRSAHFRELINNNQKPFVVAIQPSKFNERQTRQRGLFLCPGDVRQPFMQNFRPLAHGLQGIELGYKIIVPHNERLACLRRLYSLNVHPGGLFPGLDGFCNSLALRVKMLDFTRCRRVGKSTAPVSERIRSSLMC